MASTKLKLHVDICLEAVAVVALWRCCGSVIAVLWRCCGGVVVVVVVVVDWLAWWLASLVVKREVGRDYAQNTKNFNVGNRRFSPRSAPQQRAYKL